MMTLRGVHRTKVKCPKHPMFNPATKGRGEVKANCRVCFALCDAHEVHAHLERAIAYAEQLASLERSGVAV